MLDVGSHTAPPISRLSEAPAAHVACIPRRALSTLRSAFRHSRCPSEWVGVPIGVPLEQTGRKTSWDRSDSRDAMIRNEAEYQEAVRRFTEEKKRLAAHKERLAESGLSSAELKRALDPLRSFQAQ